MDVRPDYVSVRRVAMFGVALALLATAPGKSVLAQLAARPFATIPPAWPISSGDAATPFSRDSQLPSPPPTHWLEGGLIGGVIVGALGVTLAEGLCGLSDSQASCGGAGIRGALVGGSLGFCIGALIGGQVPKHKQ